jgi:hypothetical protein
LKLRVLPLVAWELASSTAVSREVLKGEEHTEKASESPLQKLSMVAKVRIEEEEKGKVRAQGSHKISVGLIGNETSYIGNLLACFGIEASIPRPAASP